MCMGESQSPADRALSGQFCSTSGRDAYPKTASHSSSYSRSRWPPAALQSSGRSYKTSAQQGGGGGGGLTAESLEPKGHLQPERDINPSWQQKQQQRQPLPQRVRMAPLSPTTTTASNSSRSNMNNSSSSRSFQEELTDEAYLQQVPELRSRPSQHHQQQQQQQQQTSGSAKPSWVPLPSADSGQPIPPPVLTSAITKAPSIDALEHLIITHAAAFNDIHITAAITVLTRLSAAAAGGSRSGGDLREKQERVSVLMNGLCQALMR